MSMTNLRRLGLLVFLGLIATLVQAQPKATLVEDLWEVAYVTDANGRDQKIGYTHLQVMELEENGKKHLRSRRELRLTVNRGSNTALIRADEGSDETLDGKLIGVYAKIWLGMEESIVIEGQMKRTTDEKGNTLDVMEVKHQGQRTLKRELPIPPDTAGIIRENGLLREKKVKTGDEFIYRQFAPTMNAFLRVSVKVGPEEELKLPSGSRKLLRVESKAEKVKIPQPSGEVQEVQLPASIQWVDPNSYLPVMTQSELPGVGTFKLLRTTKTAAMAPNGVLPNLIETQSIRLAKPIPDIHNASAINYRITFDRVEELENPNKEKTGLDLKRLVKQDARQSVEKVEKNSLTLYVEAVRAPQKPKETKKLDEEYLKSDFFINSKDERVIQHARNAVSGEKDPWKKAQRIERWVRQNMQPVNYTEALATSASVAKTLNGDCTEYAMLTAAMCRAEGIPSQTAIGLVYADDRKLGPILAFHMWTEVYIDGQWLSLDATLGQGGIGPGHIKITEHHWNKVDGFNPLLPVTAFMLAKPKIEVMSVMRPK
jgi:predicted transglutaminase-like cysteine proteinase